MLGGKTIAEVEAITFPAERGLQVEAFLTKPAKIDASARHPMIVMIHGGPHGQQGPAFNHRAQAYAAHGYAALMVNYRGSTGYGQAFSNAIARDQNGAEARDVLAGVDAALASYHWIDPARLGVEGQSYGGQLSNWLVTQTPRFAAAIPAASISNLVSHNYMSVYHDYLEQEYGGKPHTGGIIEMLWERSAIRFANRVKTPVMFIHGDNDQLVNPAEIEQFYIALKDVGVETRWCAIRARATACARRSTSSTPSSDRWPGTTATSRRDGRRRITNPDVTVSVSAVCRMPMPMRDQRAGAVCGGDDLSLDVNGRRRSCRARGTSFWGAQCTWHAAPARAPARTE